MVIFFFFLAKVVVKLSNPYLNYTHLVSNLGIITFVYVFKIK